MRGTFGLLAGVLCVGVLSGSAIGEVYTLSGMCENEQFSPGFGGADQFPFAGESVLSDVSFSFSYDSDALPYEIDGGIARYELDGSTSSFTLGANTFSFDTIRIIVGTTQFENGLISMSGTNDALGVDAGIQFESIAPIGSSLPTSFHLNDFDLFRAFSMNSDQNQFLLPILFGSVTDASLVPAPGAIAVLGLGGVFVGRRRR